MFEPMRKDLTNRHPGFRTLFLSLMAVGLALSVSSCERESLGNEGPVGLTPLSDVKIAFAAELDGESVGGETKASQVTGLTSFRAGATQGVAGSETSVWNNILFSLDRTLFVGNKFWPEDMDPVYHFYASNVEISFAASGTTVNVDNSVDVVCAYLPSSTYMSTNALSFEHVFARIGDVTVRKAVGYDLSSVSLSLIPNVGGTYNLRTGNGRTDGTGWSDLDSGVSTVISLGEAGTKSNDIYVVPGSYTLFCTWTATEDDYTMTFNKDVSIDLVGGKVNSITVTLGGNVSQIDLGISLSEWGDADVNAGTFPIV